MGYALKVPNVDFESVAVDKVTFIDAVPCTDLDLDKDALTFTKVGDTSQLSATKTPSDTTDELTWASSNENVATVDSTGLVTIHGIGTATITATCGTQTATASIAQTTIRPKYDSVVLTDKQPSQYGGRLIIESVTGQSVFGQVYHNDDTLRIGSSTDVECIPVPYGATKMKFATTDNQAHSVNYVEVVNCESLVEISGTKWPAWVKHPEFISSSVGLDMEYGQAFVFRGNSSNIEYVDYVYFE